MISLLFFLFAVAVMAGAASRFRPDAWHAQLQKPSWNPPNWVFAPVWTTLYILMAVAGWLVWQTTHDPLDPVLVVWVGQLVLNGAWTWLFFGRHRIDWALVDLVVLLGLIVAFIVLAGMVRPLAAGLFVPYLLWVGFASTLNFQFWRLNRAQRKA